MTQAASLYSGPLTLDARLIEACLLDRCKCTNDRTNRNMSTVTIWSFFTKLETDVTKAQYVFTVSVVCLCMVICLAMDRNWANVHCRFRLRP